VPKRKSAMHRYVVRRQEENRQYCVWDTKTDQPAEDGRRRYVDLQLDEAIECTVSLNSADAASGE
jgi:hypothetical protein